MTTVSKILPRGAGLAGALLKRLPFVELDWDVRQRSRFEATASDGATLQVFLPRGAVARGGDVLVADDGSLRVVRAAPQAVLVVTACAEHGTAHDLMRAAYHLGNRHVALELQPDCLLLEPDHVLAEMLGRMHLDVTETLRPFEPEGGAYAEGAAGHDHAHRHDSSHGHGHAHDHGHDHDAHGHDSHGEGHSHAHDAGPQAAREHRHAPGAHEHGHSHGHETHAGDQHEHPGHAHGDAHPQAVAGHPQSHGHAEHGHAEADHGPSGSSGHEEPGAHCHAQAHGTLDTLPETADAPADARATAPRGA